MHVSKCNSHVLQLSASGELKIQGEIWFVIALSGIVQCWTNVCVYSSISVWLKEIRVVWINVCTWTGFQQLCVEIGFVCCESAAISVLNSDHVCLILWPQQCSASIYQVRMSPWPRLSFKHKHMMPSAYLCMHTFPFKHLYDAQKISQRMLLQLDIF